MAVTKEYRRNGELKYEYLGLADCRGSAGIILYLAINARRYIRGATDFLAAGRVAGRYVIAVGDMESALGVITLVMMIERQYQCGGAIGFWGNIGVPLSLLISLTGYCVYRFRETKALPMGQFLEMRYSRGLRILAAVLRTASEMLCNCIGPAVAARFFIYFLGLPHTFDLFGWQCPTFMLLVAGVLILCEIIIWSGGRLSLLVTDCLQGLMCYPIFVIISVFLLVELSWENEIVPVISNRVAGESFLNPFDVSELRDFNIFAMIVTWTSQVLQRASWIGNDTSGCGRTPHEQKMAGVLGTWRNGFSYMMMGLLALGIMTYMWHPDFAESARTIRTELSGKVAEEVAATAPETAEEIRRKAAEIPQQIHRYQVDRPISRTDNPDTPYLDSARSILAENPETRGVFQEFRTLYHQMMLPVVLRHHFPACLIGIFTLLMIMLMLSTDDSRVFNAAATIIQDFVLPLRKTPFTPEQHLRWLKVTSIFVVLCFFFGSLFMAQMDYLAMFMSITTAIWLGGAGPVMVGGLYTRFGTTFGAYSAIVCGSGVSLAGIFLQRCWGSMVYPFLEERNWHIPVGNFLEKVSGPFQPYIVWEMNPDKFPINSYEIYFLSMLIGVAAYVIGSYLTLKEPFNLERLLHRGIYNLDGNPKTAERWTIHSVWRKIIGITPEYTKTDRFIAYLVVAWSLGYSLIIMFLGVLIWNLVAPWPERWWTAYRWWGICVGVLTGLVSTFWFLPCGIRDMIRMFRDLKTRVDNPLDDGRVEGHVSLADQAAFAAQEKKQEQ